MRAAIRVRRRTLAIAGGGAIVALVAVTAAGFGLGYFGGGAATPTTAGGPPHFVEQTAGSGLSHTYGAGDAYVVGGGVAVFDCNGDGRPDVYLAGGSNPAALYRNDSPVGGKTLAFTPIPDAATDLTGVEGAYPIDIDGDGNVTWPCCGWARRSCFAAWAAAASRRQIPLGRSTAVTT